MASVFLATAFIFLASEEVGCVEVDEATGSKRITEDCDEKVYGAFSPAALVINIATISGCLDGALLCPLSGPSSTLLPTVGVASALVLLLTEGLDQLFHVVCHGHRGSAFRVCV